LLEAAIGKSTYEHLTIDHHLTNFKRVLSQLSLYHFKLEFV
jgi:hypothetical protein